MGRLRHWLEERLGLSVWVGFFREQLRKPVPPHVNYSFTLGTAALVLFMTQVGSGILLAFNYNSSMKDAHESVRRITYEIPSGWLIRSFHAWGSHLMVIVVLAHMIRVVLHGAYKRPRELTWIFGCGLLLATLGFGYTGYLLPMDQMAYWATTVTTDLMTRLPILGDRPGEIVRGGQDVSNATLSRFFILHVWILPAALVGLVALHLHLVRRLGIAPRGSATEEQSRGYENMMSAEGVPFSRHMVREVTTVIVLLSLQATVAVLFPFGLGAPADPHHTPEAVKPEWYFLPAYQFLKYPPRLVGILLVNAALALLVLVPFLDRNPERRPRRRPFMMAAAAAALLVTLALGVLGYLSERQVGSWRFDTRGIPHRVSGR